MLTGDQCYGEREMGQAFWGDGLQQTKCFWVKSRFNNGRM